MKDKKLNILVYGGGLQGLSVGNSLYLQHDLYCISNDLQIRKSRYFKKVYTDINTEKDFYNLLGQEHFDILIPISDLHIAFVSKNKLLIEKEYGISVASPNYELVHIVEDKSRFMNFCCIHGIPHPETHDLTEYTLIQAADKIGFPALIKPNCSVGARGITRVNNLDELKSAFPEIQKKYGNCTLQEFIENQEFYYNVMMYRNNQGKIIANVVIKIVRMYPVHAGSSSCCISVENPELTTLCEDVLEKMNWVGMADFDILQRLDNGGYRIIEINPRVPASLRAAAISGVNFPEIIVRDSIGLQAISYKYEPGKILRYLGIDIMWLLKTKCLLGKTPSWFSFIGQNIYYQDIYANDISTWITWLMEGLRKIQRKSKRLR